MIVHVQLFSVARQFAGRATLELEVPATARIADVRAALFQAVPELAPLAGSLAFAVNTDYATDETPVSEGDELACLPPVSGG